MAILTATVGSNADVFPDILDIYVPYNSLVCDMTYGRGVFWKSVVPRWCRVVRSDLFVTDNIHVRADFQHLPYQGGVFDATVLDPPYMHDSRTVMDSIHFMYGNQHLNASHENIIKLYCRGIAEAYRVLKETGVLIVKCQDEISNHRQCWSHIELIQSMTNHGFLVEDLFVVVQKSIPIQQFKAQQHARKNHSYFLVGIKQKAKC